MSTSSEPIVGESEIRSFAHLTSGLAELTPAQRSMLLVLAELGVPATVQVVKEKTGLHANSVRETLTVLVEAGLVRRTAAPSDGRGRPAWEYEVYVPANISSVMTEFSDFISSVCSYLRASSENPMKEARHIGQLWSERIVAGFGSHGSTHEHDIAAMTASDAVRHPIAKLRILFSSLGFGAVSGTETDSIHLTVCPFVRANEGVDPLICQMHAGMLSSMMSELSAGYVDAQLHIGMPQRPCRVTLVPRRAAERETPHPQDHPTQRRISG